MGNVSTDDQEANKLNDDSEMHFGYIVDVGLFKFVDGTDSQWIQAMPLGTWMHPVHGSIVISKDRVKAFADNVNNNVRGQDLDIDYDHKALTTEAAGWVQQAKVVLTGEPKQRGLWLLVEWTKDAAQKIQSKAFRYFSPEFVDKWKHPATGQVFQDVLFGGAITNRPFLKGILPLNLSELVMQANENDQGDENVDRKALEILAGNLAVDFTADTSDDDLLLAITEATAADSDDDGGEGDGDGDEDGEEENTDAELVSANERLKKLAETDPAIAILLAERDESRKRLVALEIANRLSEVTIQLNEVGTDKIKLTPVAKKQLSEVLVNVPAPIGSKIMNVIKLFTEGKGTVQLDEVGGKPNSGSGSGGNTDTGARFAEEVKKLQEADKGLSFADAVIKVSQNDPALAAEYRSGSYAFKED